MLKYLPRVLDQPLDGSDKDSELLVQLKKKKISLMPKIQISSHVVVAGI